MELATSIKMGKSALFHFSLLLFTLSASADISVVAPENGATVSLLKDAQRDYLVKPVAERHEVMGNAEARKQLEACGGRPAAVKLAWSDSSFDAKAVYAIELKCAGSEKTDRFEVTGAQQAELVNLETGSTYAWKVSRVGGESAKPVSFKTAEEPRLMFFPGVANCRDIGGRKGLDGKRIRQGRVYRTAAYNASSKRVGDSFLDAKFVPGTLRITKAGRREMAETCGVKTDLDLRNEAECAGMKSSPLGTNVVWVHIPIRAYGWLDNDKSAMGKILKLFADEKSYPIAFHCSGGRDRAGSLAFILEGLLGVPEDELVKDWELSIFDTADTDFSPSRIQGLVEMLSRYPGDNVNARIEGFAKACGLTDADIAKIRANLLK